MPLWLIYTAAELCEIYSRITGSISPLTRDFIDIGRVSYYGDTERMRKDLLPVLKYRTITDGLSYIMKGQTISEPPARLRVDEAFVPDPLSHLRHVGAENSFNRARKPVKFTAN